MKYTPNLESLYLGVNKWGDESIDKITHFEMEEKNE